MNPLQFILPALLLWPFSPEQSITANQLVVDAKSRVLSSSEVASLSTHPMAQRAYLLLVAQDRLSGQTPRGLLPPATRPNDNCLSSGLYDIVDYASDGSISTAEMESLWSNYKLTSFYLLLAAQAGQTPQYLVSKAESEGLELLHGPHNSLTKYYDLLRREPQGPTEVVDFWLQAAPAFSAAIAARFADLSDTQLDYLWQKLLGMPSNEAGANRLVKARRRGTAYATVAALAYRGDPRISQVPAWVRLECRACDGLIRQFGAAGSTFVPDVGAVGLMAGTSYQCR